MALPVAVRRQFTYRFRGIAPPAPGTRVRVPLGGRVVEGWVTGAGSEVPGLRDVIAAMGPEPEVSEELLGLARWIADYYVASLGTVLHAMLPPTPGRTRGPKRQRVARVVRHLGALDEIDAVFGRAPLQRAAYERLVEAGGVQALAALRENGFSRHVVKQLELKGLVAVADEALDGGGPGAAAAAFARGKPSHAPTAAQREVLVRLMAAQRSGGGAFLLHGVTGSGKTLVYIELIRRVLARGGDALVLVPEIALTPQTVSRFRRAFGDSVAVLHSGLSDRERYDAWADLRAGRKRIAVGARSAVFAPLPRLGAIVVDEEHEASYKQRESPRYHARDVAVVRARRRGAVCVLGSATPSLESWANARWGKYALLELPERVGGGRLPKVEVVDLRSPGAEPKGGQGAASPDASAAPPTPRPATESAAAATAAAPPTPPPQIISARLLFALRARLARGEQTILLLNRRGYASFALCTSCGDVMGCVRCSVSMTLHRARRSMVCHHCGHAAPPPASCAQCGSSAVSFRGLGTEQVERIVLESLPGARIARMDMDTTGGKWSHRDILARVRDGKVDILLGTQMIAKGLDFHRVTLVGVINADIGLHLPDFRSCERTFQLLSQVAGRAGRGSLPGEVVIQTYMPDHHVIRAAVAHDYHGFVERELAARGDPPYPPRLRLARMLLSGPSQEKVLAAAETLGEWLEPRTRGGPEVLGPAPAPIEKLHGRYRWHLLARGTAPEIGRVLGAVADDFKPSGAGIRVALDRDPHDLM